MAERLISVPAARAYIEATVGDQLLKGCMNNVLDAVPAVDAGPVVHGRWEDVKETSLYVPDMKYTVTHTTETCSSCKVRIGFIGSKPYLYDNICPNCGAKMDLEV